MFSEYLEFHSDSKLLLLTKFLRPNSSNRYLNDQYWEFALKEKPIKALINFVSNGLLVPGNLKDKLTLFYTIPDLKQELRKLNLKLSGNKPDLLNRLIDSQKYISSKELENFEVYICSDMGEQIAKKYKADKQADLRNLEKLIIKFLKNQDFNQAIEIVNLYNEKQEFFGTIYGRDWNNYDINHLFDLLNIIFNEYPKILNGFSESELEILRIRAGLMILFGRNKLINKNTPECLYFESKLDLNVASRMLMFNAYIGKSLDRYMELGTKKVRIHTFADSCENCREINGKEFFIEDAIELPYRLCSHKYGCRCSYLPI